MATTRKLAELFRAISSDDLSGAATIAAQLCKSEEMKGHRAAARTLRGSLIRNGHSSSLNPDHQMNGSAGLLPTTLMRLPADKVLSEITLARGVRGDLDEVITEWKNREFLGKQGLLPRSKLLFHGPPGCGKSVTARALAAELGLPAFLVRFDAIIGSYLGQTSVHLRQLFHFADTTPCVLVLDELDALGKRRGSLLEVGELDRIVIALMQELEHSKPSGLIIGTSNLPRHLDDALWRRFDLAVAFKAPTRAALGAFVGKITASRRVVLTPKIVSRAVRSSNFADAEALIDAEIRRQALQRLRH